MMVISCSFAECQQRAQLCNLAGVAKTDGGAQDEYGRQLFTAASTAVMSRAVFWHYHQPRYSNRGGSSLEKIQY